MGIEIAYQLRRLAMAVEHYKGHQYQPVEVPWLVSERANRFTAPPEAKMFDTGMGQLVGSAEQSFAQMWLDGRLPKGKYVSVTPCFRDEASKSDQNRTWFWKAELIDVFPDDPARAVLKVINDARDYFSIWGKVEEVKTNEGFDLMMGGLEIGSYGFREKEGLAWAYGTGCAEPRLTQAIDSVHSGRK